MSRFIFRLEDIFLSMAPATEWISAAILLRSKIQHGQIWCGSKRTVINNQLKPALAFTSADWVRRFNHGVNTLRTGSLNEVTPPGVGNSQRRYVGDHDHGCDPVGKKGVFYYCYYYDWLVYRFWLNERWQ